jgi:tRNA dimethylallyltransferase
MNLNAFILVGPTAAGKSDVAMLIAEREGWSIVSAESMMVYRGMDIGTAKPVAESRLRVPHECLDLVAPNQGFSAWQFREYALHALAGIVLSGRTAMLVGGTGLYVKALVCGLETGGADKTTRSRLQQRLETEGVEAVGAELKRLAPAAYAALRDASNPRRVIRAIERAEAGALAPDGWKAAPWKGGPAVGLWVDPDVLRQRIAKRTAAMFDGGLLDEVRGLLAAGTLSETAREAIGYAEAIACVSGECTMDSAVERTVRRTCQLAKRQRTWFRHQMPVDWIDATAMDTPRTAARVLAAWREHGATVIRSEQR